MSHTPGPWDTNTRQVEWRELYARLITGPDGRVLGAAADFNNTLRDPEADANARLMAAAPDLLAALEAALEQTEDGLHRSPCDVPDCWVEAAHAAIAEAKGGAS